MVQTPLSAARVGECQNFGRHSLRAPRAKGSPTGNSSLPVRTRRSPRIRASRGIPSHRAIGGFPILAPFRFFRPLPWRP